MSFQFLLGRLETLAEAEVLTGQLRFQFLLGRLETTFEQVTCREVAVSIPLR